MKKSETFQEIKNFSRLGKEVKISPKSKVTINKPGLKKEFFVETVTILIGIGKDHTAELVMDVEAWEALKAGENVNVDSLKEFKLKFL